MIRIRAAASALLATAGLASAQGMPISTDGTDPKTWDPKGDALIAGKKNHVVIYEDAVIRVLSVTVQPGEIEVAHHHRWPSIIVLDRPTQLENRDASGNVIPLKLPQDAQKPIVLRVPPEAAHAVTNLDKENAMHLIRVEFKKGFPAD